MDFARIVVVSLTAVMLAGPLALLVSLASPSASSSEDVLAFTVPIGRMGDQVEYTYEYGWDEFLPEGVDHWEYRWKEAYKVDSVVETTDAGGYRRQALRLLAHDPSGFWGDIRLEAFLDLSSRARVSFKGTMDWSTPIAALWGVGVEPPLDAPHDQLREVESFGVCPYIAPRLFTLQGIRLEANNRTPIQELSPSSDEFWTCNERNRVLEAGYETWVGQPATFAGTSVLPVHWRAHRTVEYGTPADDRLRQFVKTDEETYWMSRDSPYPLYIETVSRSVVPSPTPHEIETRTIEVLDSVTPGSQPIPWRPFAEVHPQPADLERGSRPQSYPDDGLNSRLHHRLSAAKASAEAEGAVPGFATWLRSHHDAVLVGGRYEEETRVFLGQPLSHGNWTLVYSTPSMDVYRVTSIKDEAGRIMNTDRGPFIGAPMNLRFDAADVTKRLVTIASLERELDRLRGGEPDPGGYLDISWGYRALAQDRPLAEVYPDHYELSPSFRLHRAWISSGPSAPVRDPNLATTDGNGYPEVTFAMDMDKGVFHQWSREAIGDAPSEQFSVGALQDSLAGPAPAAAAPIEERPISWATRGLIVSSSLAAMALLAFFYPLLKYVAGQAAAFLPGYAKIHGNDVLKHHTRERLVEAIRNDPGVTPPELQRIVGGAWTPLVYHLGVLERNRLVSSLLDGRHKRFFPVGPVNHTDRARISVLRPAKTRSLYQRIQEEPGVIQSQLCRAAGLSQRGTAWHLDRLRQTGLIRKERSGRKVCYYPARPGTAETAPPAH